MNFNVETKTSTFDQGAAFRSHVQQTEDILSHYEQKDFVGSGEIIGLNANEIPNIKESIRTMCDNISAELNKIQTDADSEVAFKGEGVKTALQEYITKVTESCDNLISTMKAFNDKLTDVENQWKAAVGSMTDTISTSAGQYATGTQYTEQLQ